MKVLRCEEKDNPFLHLFSWWRKPSTSGKRWRTKRYNRDTLLLHANPYVEGNIKFFMKKFVLNIPPYIVNTVELHKWTNHFRSTGHFFGKATSITRTSLSTTDINLSHWCLFYGGSTVKSWRNSLASISPLFLDFCWFGWKWIQMKFLNDISLHSS